MNIFDKVKEGDKVYSEKHGAGMVAHIGPGHITDPVKNHHIFAIFSPSVGRQFNVEGIEHGQTEPTLRYLDTNGNR